MPKPSLTSPAAPSLAVGGFGLCGIPQALIEGLLEAGVDDLRTVSNNCGVDEWGLGALLRAKRISRTTGSYVGVRSGPVWTGRELRCL